jgi:flagellar hook-basal body complex protein FliE
MQVAQLRALRTADEPNGLPTPRGSGQFSGLLSDAIGRVDDLQKVAESTMTDFVAGKHDNVHEVVISMNEANLAFQFMTEVRNKLLEGYQELMRMQV